MPQEQHGRTKGTILTSTACILAALTFCAGFLGGTLFSAQEPARQAAAPAMQQSPQSPQSPQPSQSAPAGQDHPDDVNAHIAEVNAEIARKPEEPLNWIHLGNLYFDDNNPPEAIKAYEKALQLKPGDTDVMTDLGTMYRADKRFDKALEVYDSVIKLNPDHQNAWFNKGVTLMVDLGKPADAVAVWRGLLARKPAAALSDGTPLASVIPALATDAGSRLETTGNAQAALEAYDQALLADPAFQAAMGRRAALLDKLGRKPDALAQWKRLLEVNPQAVTPDGTPVKSLLKP